MRIACGSVEEFLQNLSKGQGDVFNNTIWFNRSVQVVNEVEQVISVQFSCIMVSDETEYLLECGENCGSDLLDEPPQLEGTQRYNRLMELVGDTDCQLLPGAIHV